MLFSSNEILCYSERDYEQHMMFDAVFFLLFIAIKHIELKQNYFYIEPKYLEMYSDMSQPYNCDDLDTILFYRNIMKCAMIVICPSGNKGYLLDFVTRIVEGVHKKYITGSGATLDTKRRVKIYEVEGEMSVTIRPERRKIKVAKMLGSLGALRPSDPMFCQSSNDGVPPNKSLSSHIQLPNGNVEQTSTPTTLRDRETAESILSLFQSSTYSTTRIFSQS